MLHVDTPDQHFSYGRVGRSDRTASSANDGNIGAKAAIEASRMPDHAFMMREWR